MGTYRLGWAAARIGYLRPGPGTEDTPGVPLASSLTMLRGIMTLPKGLGPSL